jgi:hypothetical protein
MSEKNWLENLADAIPGLKGYRDKEARRDTDKRFREYLASRIEASRKTIEELKRTQVNQGRLQGLDELDRLTQKLMKTASLIRYASYGYSGFFDQVKIQEAELDKIYQFDLSLLTDVEALENSMKQGAQQEWSTRIDALENRLEERKYLFAVTGS